MFAYICICAEIVANYVLMLFVGGIFFALSVGFGAVWWADMLFADYTIVAIPAAVLGATIGLRVLHRHSLTDVAMYGFYQPIRPIALIFPAVRALMEEARRS